MRKVISIVVLTLFLLVSLLGCSAGSKTEADKPSSGANSNSDEKVVYITQVGPADMSKQLAAGEIDGFIAWEPFNAQAVLEKQGNYLKLSGDIWPQHPCCVLAVSDKLADEATIKALLYAHIKATRFINNPDNKDKVLRYAQEFTGKSAEVVTASLQNIKFVEYPDKAEFAKFYQELAQGKLLKKNAADLGFRDEQQLFDDFLIDKYYLEVKQNIDKQPDWKPQQLDAKTKINIGYLTRDLHELAIFVAQKERFYQEVGLTPGENLVIKEYPNGVAAMEGFKAKELDVSYLGGSPAVLKRVNDDIKIHVIAGANNEGSAIIVKTNSPIEDVAGLTGKTIAVPAIGTVQYFILQTALDKAGLKVKIK